MTKWNVCKVYYGWQESYEYEMDINLYREWLESKEGERSLVTPWLNWFLLRLELQENGSKYD